MRKRFLSIIIAGTITLTAAGCSCSQPAEVTPGGTEDLIFTTEATAPETTGAPETAAPTTAAPETTAAVKDVTISLEVYQDKDGVRITYPVLDGLSDANLQKKWNDLFLANARADVAYLVEGDTFTSTWEVASGTARVMSLVKTTVLTDEEGNTKRSMEAYNIDSKNGQMKRLSQLSDVNAIAKDLAAAAKALADKKENTAYVIFDDEGKDITAKMTLNDLLTHYKSLITGPAAKDLQAGLVRLLGNVDYTDNGQIAGYSVWRGSALQIVFPYDAEVSDYIVIEVKDAHRSSTSK